MRTITDGNGVRWQLTLLSGRRGEAEESDDAVSVYGCRRTDTPRMQTITIRVPNVLDLDDPEVQKMIASIEGGAA